MASPAPGISGRLGLTVDPCVNPFCLCHLGTHFRGQEAIQGTQTRVSCRCQSHVPGADLSITGYVLKTFSSRRAEPGLLWDVKHSWQTTTSWPLLVCKSPNFRVQQITLPLRLGEKGAGMKSVIFILTSSVGIWGGWILSVLRGSI